MSTLAVGAEDTPDPLALVDTPRASRPLLLVTSGGVSKGAYQAGVSWAILNLLKDAGRPGIHLQPHELVVSTGASAGSANVLLSVAEWAQPRAVMQAPHVSPYWEFWTSLGLSEVIPPCRTCDPKAPDIESALSRRVIEEVLVPEAMERLSGPEVSLDRPIYIGYTLTTREPIDVVVSDDLTVPSLRASLSASATPVWGVDGTSLGVSFESVNYRLPDDDGPCPSGARPYPEMGPVVHARLGALAQTADGSDARVCDPRSISKQNVSAVAIRNRDQVARGGVASAAFPYAWAPVSLDLAVGLNAEGFPSEEPAPPREFLDGGVFDNNPLSLAIQLGHRASYNATPCSPSTTPLDWSRRTVLFVDQDARRPRLPAPVDSVGSPGDHNRVTDVVSFLNQFLDSGRAFEIESESRHLSPEDAEGLQATSRGFPIVGSELSSFATFLARPFRLYDFYAGVYDGYVHAAQHLSDDPPTGAMATGRAVLSLYDASGLAEADPLADVVFRGLIQAEFPSTGGSLAERPAPETHPEVDVEWALVLREHVEVAVAHRASPSWFVPLTAHLTSRPEVEAIFERWGRECEQAGAESRAVESALQVSRPFIPGRDCNVTPQFLPILHEPMRRLLGIGGEILTHRVEVEGEEGSAGFSLGLAALNVYLSTNRPGPQFNRSIVPDVEDGLYGASDYSRSVRLRRWLVRGVLPARVLMSNGPYFATSALSWRAGRVHLVTEVAPLRRERVVREGDMAMLTYSGLLGADLPVLSGAAGLGFRASYTRTYEDRGEGIGVEAFVRVGHALSLGVVATPWGGTWLDDFGRPTRFSRQAYVSASLHDLGGLLYWFSRVVAS